MSDSYSSPALSTYTRFLTRPEGTIDRTIFRAIAKIAFNYCAYNFKTIASMEQFGLLRRFVRYDEPMKELPVSIVDHHLLGGVPEAHQVLAHTLTVAWDPRQGAVIAHVSLLSSITYRVVLSSGSFVVRPEFLSSGHLYDPMNKRILPLTRQPPGRGGAEFPAIPLERFKQSFSKMC